MKLAAPILVEKKEYCCGCGACKAACKINAITMKRDEYGFEFPVIDQSKCVGCKKCKDVCAYQNSSHQNKTDKSFAAVSKSTDVMLSASGGVFASVAAEFIKDGGIAAGCSLESNDGLLEPKHIIVDKIDDLHKLLGSKYVHSDTSEIFEKIKQLLSDNKNILFSGTPCQVDALYSYLGKRYDNLYTIDLICHGVPSKKMFSDYLSMLSNKYGIIRDFNFRDKKNGLTYMLRVTYTKNEKENIKHIHHGESSYYTYFIKSLICRDCCYNCKYANENRVGDITIGDFWGIKTQHPELFDGSHSEFDSDKGISCILQNTEQGKRLIEYYGKGLSLYPSTFEKVEKENKQLSEPSVPKGDREEIMNIYKLKGYEEFDKYFMKQEGSAVLVSKLKSKAPLWLKKMIKK